MGCLKGDDIRGDISLRTRVQPALECVERREGNYNEENVQQCYQLQPAPSLVGNLEGNVFR